LTELKPRFDKQAIGLVAISADPRADSAELIQDDEISVPLLSDPELQVISAYGVAMKGEDIAVPAAFVISPQGNITFSYIGESMADRPDGERLLRLAGQAGR